MLHKILQDEKRYGVVGLPCHIHGFRKAQEHVKGLKYVNYLSDIYSAGIILYEMLIGKKQLGEVDRDYEV